MTPNTGDKKPNNPNEYLNIPKWVNAKYFESILEQDVPNYAKVLNFTSTAATAPGENYTSIMVRVAIEVALSDGSQQSVSYILKTALEPGNQGAEFITSMNLFPKECEMYQTILPQYVQLYKEAGVHIQFGPRCLHVEEKPERITLVMEDLKLQNFKNMNRMIGLDFEHTTQLLLKLAELHAASARYEELNGPFSEMYHTSFYCEATRPIFQTIAEPMQKLYIDAMRTWDLENIESYIAKLPSLDVAFEEGYRLNVADPNDFNVLNHGDCWTNNFMFAHAENGDLERTLFVDFQVGHWGSPAQDLWYFTMSSTNTDIRVKEFDNLIHIYHKRLVECLKLLQYSKPLPTLKSLHISLLKYSFWSNLITQNVMPAVLFPSDKDANMDSFLTPGPECDALRMKTFTNKYYVNAMKQILPFLDHKGVLDV